MACIKLLSIGLQKRNRNLSCFLLILAFLLMSSFNPSQFMAHGRQFPYPNLRKDREYAAKMRAVIGSRPPRCDRMCRNCGNCEAVQVPIAAAMKLVKEEIKAIAYSRGDDISNYKPMCWKCKCGGIIFNP